MDMLSSNLTLRGAIAGQIGMHLVTTPMIYSDRTQRTTAR